MAWKLTPREHVFYDLLASAGENIGASGRLLTELATPGADRKDVASRMRDLEHRGDGITHDILRLLNRTFVTPFDREDIYRLAGTLDNVVDALEEATDFLDLASVGELPELVLDQIRVIDAGCDQTAVAMGQLEKLANLESYWIEVNRLENEADNIYRRLQANLFSGEYDVMTMLKLREVATLLESAADSLEHVAHAVETIAVKES